MARESSPARIPALSVSPTTHTHQLVTDDPDVQFVVNVKGTGGAIFNYLRSLRQRSAFRNMPSLCANVLLLMIDCVNGKAVRSSGRLLCWPSVGYLARECGSSDGHTRRALQWLIAAGIVKRTKMGGGLMSSSYQLVVPEERHDLRNTLCGRVDTPSAGASTPPARRRAVTPRAGARAPCAPARTRNKESENGDRNNNNNAAVVAELEKLEIEPGQIRKLLALPTSTPAVLRAAITVAMRRPPQYRPGKAIQLIRDPSEIPANAVKRAEAALAAAASPLPSRPTAPSSADRAARARAIVDGLPPDRMQRLLDQALRKSDPDHVRTWQRAGRNPLDVPAVIERIATLAKADGGAA